MPQVCPKCQGLLHGQLQCPQCGALASDSVKASAPVAVMHRPTPSVAPPLGVGHPVHFPVLTRLFVGLLLAQGFYYGTRQIGQAFLLSQGQPDWWDGLPGLIALQALQAAALLIGGVVAGAGHSRGLIPGALLGLANAGLILLVEVLLGQPPAPQMRVILPVLHAVIGSLGGSLGARIWRPLPSVPSELPDAAPGGLLPTGAMPVLQPVSAPVPWAWGRILVGAALAVAGFCFDEKILDFVTANGFSIPGGLQRQLVAWEIAALGMVLGAGLAGATTSRGFSQGLMAGLLTAPVVLAVHLARHGDYLPGQEFLSGVTELPLGSTQVSAPMLVYLVIHTVVLGGLSGWLAAQLLPRLHERRRSRDDFPV